MVLFRVSLRIIALQQNSIGTYWAQEFDSSVLSVLTTDQGSDRISLQNECKYGLRLTSPNQAFSYKPFPWLSSMLAFQKLSLLAKCAATLLYLRMPMPLLTLCHLWCPFFLPACLSKGYYYSVFNCSSLSCHRPPCMLLLKAVVLQVWRYSYFSRNNCRGF